MPIYEFYSPSTGKVYSFFARSLAFAEMVPHCPEQMGSLMRKMCDLTGEKMDQQMEEVVRKLEEGADPDDLEDQMGAFTEEPDLNPKEEESGTGSKVKKALSKKLIRDPQLYEFADFV